MQFTKLPGISERGGVRRGRKPVAGVHLGHHRKSHNDLCPLLKEMIV
jgi:hypothetical protein